jgi:hypothetical protein
MLHLLQRHIHTRSCTQSKNTGGGERAENKLRCSVFILNSRAFPFLTLVQTHAKGKMKQDANVMMHE